MMIWRCSGRRAKYVVCFFLYTGNMRSNLLRLRSRSERTSLATTTACRLQQPHLTDRDSGDEDRHQHTGGNRRDLVRREFGKASRTDDVVARGLAIVDDRPVDDKVSRAKRAVRAAADAARGVEAQRRIVADQRRLVAEEKALLASEAKLAAARDLAAAKVDAARAARALQLAADARLGGDVM